MDSKDFNLIVREIKNFFPLSKVKQSFKEKKIFIKGMAANSRQIDYLELRYNSKVYNTINIFNQEKTLVIIFQ